MMFYDYKPTTKNIISPPDNRKTTPPRTKISHTSDCDVDK